MSEPFAIEGPAAISFSGGRTSALMLRRVLDAGIRHDVHVLFANTGKERPETLDFVRQCGERWDVAIHWIEWHEESGINEVTYASASREGEPFARLIAKRKFLPNPVTRFCTQELKIRPMKKWMLARGYEHWTNVVGIRADEPSRVARLRASEGKDCWDVAMPLADAGVTEHDVLDFWSRQPFDLRLRAWEGNCDLCFLKGRQKRERIMLDRPDLAAWWIQREATGAKFRSDAPSYSEILRGVQRQGRLFQATEDDLGDCICHD